MATKACQRDTMAQATAKTQKFHKKGTYFDSFIGNLIWMNLHIPRTLCVWLLRSYILSLV